MFCFEKTITTYFIPYTQHEFLALSMYLSSFSKKKQMLKYTLKVNKNVIYPRVNLGLIPSSDISWKTAVKALKPTGGVLHIHTNVEERYNQICNIFLCENYPYNINPNMILK